MDTNPIAIIPICTSPPFCTKDREEQNDKIKDKHIWYEYDEYMIMLLY